MILLFKDYFKCKKLCAKDVLINAATDKENKLFLESLSETDIKCLLDSEDCKWIFGWIMDNSNIDDYSLKAAMYCFRRLVDFIHETSKNFLATSNNMFADAKKTISDAFENIKSIDDINTYLDTIDVDFNKLRLELYQAEQTIEFLYKFFTVDIANPLQNDTKIFIDSSISALNDNPNLWYDLIYKSKDEPFTQAIHENVFNHDYLKVLTKIYDCAIPKKLSIISNKFGGFGQFNFNIISNILDSEYFKIAEENTDNILEQHLKNIFIEIELFSSIVKIIKNKFGSYK
jgi:hypothetical protein